MGQRIASLPKVNHLWQKIWFTLGFLALYRIGVHVPVPGVDTLRLSEFFSQQGGNLFGMFNTFSGGALERFSVFALGVMPYISASIIAQLLTVTVPQLEALQKEGESGRKVINQYTRYGTVVLALIQGYAIAQTLESAQFQGGALVLEGGFWWKMLTMLSLASGTAFVMWLGERITEKGVGNGMSLIIFAGIVSGLPGIVSSTYEQFASNQLELYRILILIAMALIVIAGVVFMEQGARQVPVQYAKRQVGNKVYGGQATHLPMRVNASGVIPPIFASSLLQFPTMIGGLYKGDGWGQEILAIFGQGWFHDVLFVVLIVFFAFFYTSIVFKSDDIAENLKKNGGFIPGIRPGARTAEYLNKVLYRLTLAGSIYLALICVLPTILTSQFNVQFYFGGTSLLIVVGVALETFRQIDAHMQSLRYETFLKAGSIRPRGRRA